MLNEMQRVNHICDYITKNYAKMDPKKFDVVKVGARIYLYAIDSEGNLQRHKIFQGNLPAINELSILKQEFEKNIKEAIQKIGLA